MTDKADRAYAIGKESAVNSKRSDRARRAKSHDMSRRKLPNNIIGIKRKKTDPVQIPSAKYAKFSKEETMDTDELYKFQVLNRDDMSVTDDIFYIPKKKQPYRHIIGNICIAGISMCLGFFIGANLCILRRDDGISFPEFYIESYGYS